MDLVQHTVVRSSTLFTFGYPNLMLSLLQYISFYFNIDIATFVCFQIAIYAYVVLRTFTYTSPSSPSLRLTGVLFHRVKFVLLFYVVCICNFVAIKLNKLNNRKQQTIQSCAKINYKLVCLQLSGLPWQPNDKLKYITLLSLRTLIPRSWTQPQTKKL